MRYDVKLTSRSGKPTGYVGRVILSLLLAVFITLGSIATVALMKGEWAELKMRSWTPTPCTVVRSGLSDSIPGGPFELTVTYHYLFPATPGGPLQAWSADTIKRDEHQRKSDDYREIRALADRYAVDAPATCYVDPANPSNAILERGSLWIIAAVPVTLGVVLLGIGGVYLIWRRERPDAPLSKEQRPPGKWVGVAASLFFLLGGLGILLLFLNPIRRMIASRSWTPTAAAVIWSSVKTSSGEHGDTYSVDVFYKYIVGDQEFRSNRYEFTGFSSSGRDAKQLAVDEFSAGTFFVCYVNPEDPTDAVIERSPSWTLAFAIIPLIFVVLGLLGLLGTVHERRQLHRNAARDAFIEFTSRGHRRPVAVANRLAESLKLSPTRQSRTGVIGVWIVLLILGAVYSGIALHEMNAWRNGKGEFGPTLVLVLFAFASKGLIGKVVEETWRLLAPRIELFLEPPDIFVGGSAVLRWNVSRSQIVRGLKVRLVGCEETNANGVESAGGERAIFFDREIIQTKRRIEITSGSARVEIPLDAMQSWAGTKNRIQWSLHATCDVPRRPKIDETFEIEVSPAPMSAHALPNARSIEEGVLPIAASSADDALSLSLEKDQPTFAPGERIRGTARWAFPAPRGEIDVRLIVYAQGNENLDVSIIAAQKLKGASDNGAEPFDLLIPPGAPPSFVGELVTLHWALELVMQQSRAVRIDVIVSRNALTIDPGSKRI